MRYFKPHEDHWPKDQRIVVTDDDMTKFKWHDREKWTFFDTYPQDREYLEANYDEVTLEEAFLILL